jgi:hypothetical protein
VDGGPAAEADPLGDAFAGGFVVFADDVVADSVKGVGVDGDALIGAPHFPTAQFGGDEAMLGEFGLRRDRERGEPRAGGFSPRIGRRIGGAGGAECEQAREEREGVALHGNSERLCQFE